MKEQKIITAIDIINFKKVSIVLTGKDFNLRADRGFGKHTEQVNELISYVEKWIDGVKSKSEVPTWKEKLVMKSAEKKSNPADIKYSETTAESYEGKKINPGVIDEPSQFVKPDVKKDKVRILQEIANTITSGKSVKSEIFASKKKPIEEEYDFEYVTSLPDLESQVPIGAKGMAFYDRYDLGRFYVRYEGKCLRFENEKEFNRFAKDNQIK